MNIVYLIGNGFDLSLDLPTAYSDFYNYYVNQPNIDSEIESLKSSIETDRVNWSDLEEALGKYTTNLHTTTELIKLHKDLINNLRNYLKKVEDYYNWNDSQKELISKYLICPENILPYTDQQNIQNFKSKWSGIDWQVKIITFNYTTILEKLIGYTGQQKRIGNTNYNRTVILKDIQHIHGSIIKGMALGLNDPSQFLNETYREDRLLKNKYIKQKLNVVARTGHDDLCQVAINGANLICIFGLSFGITDLRWWQYIGDRIMQKDILLILFYHNDKINLDDLDDAELFEEEDNVRNLFLSMTSLSDTDKEQVREKIFVSINSSMFKIDNENFKK